MITTPTSSHQNTNSAFLFVWLSTWGSEWGEDTSWVWRGEGRGCRAARHVCAHLELLYKEPVPAAIPPAWTAWPVTPGHDARPRRCRHPHPHPLPATPLGACSGHKNIIKILFLNYDYKSNSHFVSSKCYMCIILTCDWREDYRFRTFLLFAFAMHSFATLN